MAEPFDYMLKMVIVGNTKAGKTAFLERYCKDVFSSSYIPTVGIDFKIKSVSREDKKVKLQIWDTAGDERFKSITAAYYPGAHGFIVMFDLSDEESFHATENWISEIQNKASDGAPIVLVGNKSDLTESRVITKEQGEELAKFREIEYLETSAKDDVNVNEAFEKLTELMYAHVIDK